VCVSLCVCVYVRGVGLLLMLSVCMGLAALSEAFCCHLSPIHTLSLSTHTHTHTHMYMYVYVCMCMCVCVYLLSVYACSSCRWRCLTFCLSNAMCALFRRGSLLSRRLEGLRVLSTETPSSLAGRYRSIFTSVSLSIYLFIYLSMAMRSNLPDRFISIFIFKFLSAYLSIYLYVCMNE